MSILLPTFIVVLLIAVNALYVAAEFAAVSVRRSRIQQMAHEGNRLAGILLRVVQNPVLLDRYIAACQVGITLSSLVLGAYGQATLPGAIQPILSDLGVGSEAAAQSVSAFIVLVFLTSTQVILGELVPKSLALQFPAQVGLYTVVPMRWSLAVLRPFIAVLNGSGLLILRIMGASQGGHGHIHSPDEIELLIVQSGDGGFLEPDERARLRRALHLSERRAHQIMVPRPRMEAIDAEQSLAEIEQQVTDSPFTRLPVYRESIDNVVGLVHTKDVMLQSLEHGGLQSLDRLIRPAVMVPESAPVYRVLTTLQESRAHQALVIDEFGGVSGLLTMDDVLGEVLGNLGDEYAPGEALPVRVSDGRLRLPGTMLLEEAAPFLGVEWEGHSDTIGGRVTEALEHLPTAGECVEIDGVGVEVESVEHHAVVSVLVRPRPPGGDGDE